MPTSTSPATPPRPDLRALLAEHGRILLFDGVCGLCDSSVQFILRHDRVATLRFATLQGAIGEAAREALPTLRAVDSVILLQPDGAQVKSTAVLQVADYLGGGWRALAALGWLVPRVLRDGMYDLVARTRYRVFGRLERCRIPTAEERARFLDP